MCIGVQNTYMYMEMHTGVIRKWICMLVILYTLRVYCLNPGFIREYWRCSFSATAAASELAWCCHPHIIYCLWIVVTVSAFFDSCQSFPIASRRFVDGAGRTPLAPDGCSVPYLACVDVRLLFCRFYLCALANKTSLFLKSRISSRLCVRMRVCVCAWMFVCACVWPLKGQSDVILDKRLSAFCSVG